MPSSPIGNDRAQAKSVFAGECDLAIANTYYMGKMLTNNEEPEQKDWAKAVQHRVPRLARLRHAREHLRRAARQERTQQATMP